jgi:hypothetical protein
MRTIRLTEKYQFYGKSSIKDKIRETKFRLSSTHCSNKVSQQSTLLTAGQCYHHLRLSPHRTASTATDACRRWAWGERRQLFSICPDITWNHKAIHIDTTMSILVSTQHYRTWRAGCYQWYGFKRIQLTWIKFRRSSSNYWEHNMDWMQWHFFEMGHGGAVLMM